ncbi:hypothetical protein I316_01215 [Kwoniella heveanensis BCC8398]|uniref:Enhancer of polycomb-like protein n=1 Tax=Kwoniella heveanensis BCC8398 TaxID=1296120 RepID=A0A1B9H209_9TREE|nr:hypothetical protein I316_01215 [Kwoniella heveanensis BCC8398]
MAPGRMVTSSRRAGRVTNKTKLLIYKGTDKVDLSAAETIVWESDPSSSSAHAEQTKHQHVGAKGVESGELLEHHLQAALSSASLLHSRAPTSKPSSPNDKSTSKPEFTSSSSLAYHIPTPDASGVVDNNAFAPLYQATKYVEPVNYIRFSDTVEESSGGWGGLGYCMDDKDVKWLNEFNAKAEGSSGANGDANAKGSPQTSKDGSNASQSPSIGRGMRAKGKEKEKSDNIPTQLFISEDTFEYIMGVLEKFAEDSAPMLHTNISLLPPFASVEPMFSSPIPATFLPSNEIPKTLPDLKVLSRMARNVYPHWKARREEREGKSIMPALNYDETNDNDPYVCFRRRDIRATRKTRRTDNFSIEQFQKLQTELRNAHNLAQMVVRRENEKKLLFKADQEVWEAKWKLFEIKRRWPSLGMTREEEEIITGRPTVGVAPVTIPSMANGLHALQTSQTNIPQPRKKASEKDRDDKEKRERVVEATRTTDKGISSGLAGRSNAPDALKERMLVLQQRLEELMAKKKEADSHWDDCTDSSYQPLPLPQSVVSYKPVTSLDPHHAHAYHRGRQDSDEESDEEPLYHTSFRLRRGRGGVVRLDRRAPLSSRRRAPPATSSDYPDWLFPDRSPRKSTSPRPRSVDEVLEAREQEREREEEEADSPSKRRRLNEICRYDVSRGGALGVGMGVAEDQDRVIVDDLESKYIRNRISLLHEEDWNRLKPDTSALDQAIAALDAPVELPPVPTFIRPQMVPPNPQMVAAHLQQQQLLQQQQQMEQFQRFQLIAQQQALVAQQQQQAALAQAQAQGGGTGQRAPSASAEGTSVSSPSINGGAAGQGHGIPPPNGMSAGQPQNSRPPVTKRPSQNASAQMAPPPQPARPTVSPNNSMHPTPVMNGQSPQLANGVPPNAKQFSGKGSGTPPANANGNGTPTPTQMDQVMQQRLMAARAIQQPLTVEQLNPEQLAEVSRLAQQAGFGNDVHRYLEARNRQNLLKMAKLAQQQQAQHVQQQQAQAAAQAQAQAQVQAQAQAQAQGQQNGNGAQQAPQQQPKVQPNAQQPQQQQQQQQQPGQAQGQGQGGNQTQNSTPTFSPALPNSQMQLKLPAHAAARLGAAQTNQQQAPPAQRA